MPTVLRIDGFQIMMYPPPREHGPAHVHVFRGDDEVVILLNTEGEAVTVRHVRGMAWRDAWQALQIIEDHAELLRAQWEEYHG